jgi:hypothetical protein
MKLAVGVAAHKPDVGVSDHPVCGATHEEGNTPDSNHPSSTVSVDPSGPAAHVG